MNDVKSIKLTIGRLVTLIVVVLTIGSGAIALARWSDISRHESKSIYRAHPDARDYMVSKQELQKILRKIDNKLAKIEVLIVEIKKK